MVLEITFPLVTCSEANTREHWTKSAKRHAIQKQITKVFLLGNKIPTKLPVKITLCRLSPRTLDSDNLQMALKYIRDSIADYFIPGLQAGRADDNKGFSWNYAQEKSKMKGVRITFE